MKLFKKSPFYISLFVSTVFCFVCSSLLFFVPTANAQFNEQPGADVGVVMNPENPGPNELVNVSISSFSTDLNAASITWKINNKTIKSGKGVKTFSFSTGGFNSTTDLDIVIYTNEGDTVEKSYSITPTNVDLVWQAYGYTPPFYKGKTLFSHQDMIQFVAIPHMKDSSGREISPKNLIYTWTRNGSVAGDYSGYGKNTYTVVGSIISRPLDVSVEVSSPDVNGVGTAEVVASPIEPTVLMYEKSPLYGIQFQKALTNTVELNDAKEITVIGIPYFFGVLNPTNRELSYTWSINNIPNESDTISTTKVFRPLDGTSGFSNISLSITDTSKILQFASSDFNLSFGNKNDATQ